MRKKAALIAVLFSAVLLFSLYPQPIPSNSIMYSPSTHGGAGL
jgi:hypothetical protein